MTMNNTKIRIAILSIMIAMSVYVGSTRQDWSESAAHASSGTTAEFDFAMVNAVVPNGLIARKLAAASADNSTTGEDRSYPVQGFTSRVTLRVNTVFNQATGTTTYSVSKNGNPTGVVLNVPAGAINNSTATASFSFAPGDTVGLHVISDTAFGAETSFANVKLY